MRKILFLLLVFSALPAFATTYYVDHIGGSRFSSRQTAGLCNGTADTAPVGTTPNQNCAFNDVRYLWMDGSYNADTAFPGWGWLIAGGDTVIIKDCVQYPNDHSNAPTPGSSGMCRIGPNGDGTVNTDAFGAIWGNNGASGAPPPPAGTAGAHTRILGANYASCGSVSAMAHTQGGYGVGSAWALNGTSYVDFQCIDVTDGSICNRASVDTTAPCSTSVPLSDYATNGVSFDRNTTNVAVTNVYVHGTSNSCFAGPTGDGTVITNVTLSGCPHSTWDADPGDGTTGTGHLTMNNLNMAFSGFEEVWPINHANDITLPTGPIVGQVGDGTDQTHGGYGDAIGTATATSSPAWIMAVNGGSCQYATQDCYDLLHLQGNDSTITIKGALVYGAMGQQIKLGAAGLIANSLVTGNCNALKFLPGLATNAVANLSDYCRAGDAAVVVAVSDGFTTTYEFNTLFTASHIGLEVAPAAGPCDNSTCVFNYRDNIMVGFTNSVANGYSVIMASDQQPNPLYFDAGNPFPIGASIYSNNASFNLLTACPDTGNGEVNALCTSPQLVDMNWHLYSFGNMAPASGSSAVVGQGIAISGITTDFNGTNRPNPPSIGALEFAAGPPTVATPTPSPVAGTYTSTQSVTLTTITAGATICYTVDGSTPTGTGGACGAGSTTYSGAITVATTTTIKALGTLSGDSNSSVFSGLYTITPPVVPPVGGSGTVKLSGSVTIP